MQHIKGPDFPTGGIILGTSGHPRRLRDRPRPRARAGAARTSSRSRSGKEAIIVTELPYQVKKGGDNGLIAKIAELVHDKKIPEISDIARRVRQAAACASSSSSSATRMPEGRPQQALQAHADADDVRREHGRARRRRPEDARRCARSSAHYVDHQREVVVRRAEARAAPEGGARAHPRGPAHRARQPRRGHRADPRLAPTARPRATGWSSASGSADDPGRGDPRPAPRRS